MNGKLSPMSKFLCFRIARLVLSSRPSRTMPSNSAPLAPFVLPVLSCLVLLVAIAIAWIVKKALEKNNNKKKPAQTAPGAAENPEASTQPPDEEKGGIELHAQPRVRPPTRLSRTPTPKMTREQHATFTAAIHTVVAEGNLNAPANGA